MHFNLRKNMNILIKNEKKKEAFKASLKPVSFTAHDLRYTYATMLFDAGVDEKTAQKWLGHTSPEMTRDLYAQLTKEREAKSDKNYTEYLKRFDPTRPQNWPHRFVRNVQYLRDLRNLQNRKIKE